MHQTHRSPEIPVSRLGISIIWLGHSGFRFAPRGGGPVTSDTGDTGVFGDRLLPLTPRTAVS